MPARALLSLVVAALAVVACAGRRADPPPGLTFPRAQRVPSLRVERLLADGAAVRLDRLDGFYRLAQLGAVVDLPYTAALTLEDPGGERVRVLLDHHPDERLPLVQGMPLHVRYARHDWTAGRHEVLALRDGAGRLRFLSVARPLGAAAFADEAALPPALRLEPTEERVYRESLRQESYCTTARDHFAARLPEGARSRRVAPGERVQVPGGETSWRLHLVDLARSDGTDCVGPVPDRLVYQVYGPE